jgi:hypothetical protein
VLSTFLFSYKNFTLTLQNFSQAIQGLIQWTELYAAVKMAGIEDTWMEQYRPF